MKDSFKNTDGIFVRRQNQPSERKNLDHLLVPSRRVSDIGPAPRPMNEHIRRDLPPVLGNDSRDAMPSTPISAQAPARRVRAIDIDLSLDDKKGKKRKHRFWLTRKVWKRFGLCVGAILLVIVGYFAWKIFSNVGKVFQGNVFNAVASVISPDKALKADQHGNTNILLLGTSESDPNHPAAQLTDSMMVVSFNKQQKTAFLLSIPRDLWVKYDTPCSVGYQGKINSTYECALGVSSGGLANANNDETVAEAATATKVSSVTGVDIQYVVHMNLAVVQKVVDAVGGIDIIIQSPDPRGILDRNFDWRCQYKCYLVKYPNGPAHLDGYHAMWLVQARNDAGGYGLPRSNFDREANQRKVIIAVENKALGVGFLANPLNVTNLLDALGSNVHTTIDSSEIKSFISIAKSVSTSSIVPIDILNDAPGILGTGTGPDGSSIVRPNAGLFDYSALQALAQKLLMGHAPLIQEAATVDVLNGSGVSGAASQEADKLSKAGFTIGNVASAPSDYAGTDQYTLYDLSKGGKPGTLTALKQALGVNKTQTVLPTGVTSASNFVVILGKQTTTTSNSTGQ